jgi:ABC-2 type transport system ATP-binding protein
MTLAIELIDIRKTYPRKWASPAFEAVKGISLAVNQGEVFGFIGPNGAGKSTTIKILTGVVAATAGDARMFGVSACLPGARRGLGYVPENSSLPDYLTPLEILSMGLELHQVTLPDARKHCLYWLDRFGLAAVSNKVLRGFSKGMAQRTALAHAMAVEPRLLILDEPLSGLDPIGRRDVVDILAEYRKQGGTIFLTSHVLHDVERLADRFGMIHKGELKTIQSPSELIGSDNKVIVRTSGVAPVPGMTDDSGGRWSVEVSQSALWGMLKMIEAANHQVIEVKPVMSLESAFMRYSSSSESR